MLANWIIQGKQQDISTEKELRRHHSAPHSSLSAEVGPEHQSVLSCVALAQNRHKLIFSALQDVLHQMQHHTLTVEECNGSKCTTEVVNVHDTAMLNDTQHIQNLLPQTRTQVNSTDSRLGSVTIQKQVGKPLVVTVKQDEADPGLQVKSGGALLTDDAKNRVALLNQAAAQSNLSLADPASARKAADIAEELSKHGAAAHHEGDNVLDIHRDDIDIDLSKTEVNPVSVNVTDENSLQIMQDTNSSSLLSGFNSEKQREEQQQQGGTGKVEAASDKLTGVTLESSRRQLHADDLSQPGSA